jgi:hypothetical protein
MAADLEKNDMPDPLPEAYYHNLARNIHAKTHLFVQAAQDSGYVHSPEYDPVVRYDSFYPLSHTRDAFASWPLMGLSRTHRIPGVLWHDSHTPANYCDLAHAYGLQYNEDDFDLTKSKKIYYAKREAADCIT